MLKNKPTAIIGASPNADRYSYKATISLLQHSHPVFPIGIRSGQIHGVNIITEKPMLENIDTVTLYVGPDNQPAWYDYILSLHPKRVIFNPGTENAEFEHLLQKENIEVVDACTLVLLSTGQY